MVLTSFYTPICLPPGEILNFLALSATIIAILSSIILIYLSYFDTSVKWIRKESEALDALLKDLDQLREEVKEVKSRARQFWDSEVKIKGIGLQLREPAEKWVERANKVASNARHFLANFDEQREIGFLPTELFRIVSIYNVICQIYRVKSAIRNLLEQKDRDAEEIYETMEISRSKIRGLLNQYTIQEDKKSVSDEEKNQCKYTSIQKVMTTSKHLFSAIEERWSFYLLHPLYAVLKDLSQLQLETETEETWKRQAEELIQEAEDRINKFSWWVSTFGSTTMSNPIVKIKFKWGMKPICAEFDRLLERKEIYRFKFIDRAARKPIRGSKSTYDNTGDVKAITVTINKIRCQLEKEESSSEEEEVNEIDSLCGLLEEMRNTLQEREDAAGRNACLEQIKCIAEEIEQGLESYLKKPQLKHFQRIQQAATLLKRIIDASYIEPQDSNEVLGLENDKRRLVTQLITNGNRDSAVSIVGMKGIGKTTLAKEIFSNRTVVKCFPVRVWVTADQQESQFRAQVLEMKEDGIKSRICSLTTEVRNILKEKHGLLVVDDISTQEGWDLLKSKLGGMTQGIRIVLTTRSKNVALHADTSSSLHQLRLRTKEESWELFQKVISKPRLDSAVEKRARKVVGKCGGLPLAILSLGYLMSANGVNHEPLEWASDRINRGQNEIPWLDVEENIYRSLDEILMNCLSHFILFPEDFEIPARRLINLWVAEGFVKQDESSEDKKKTFEDVAEEYLQELSDCNIIQAVELKSNGKIKTCRLPNLLRELILKRSNRKGSNQYQSLSRQVQQRFAYKFDDRDAILGADANLANVLSRKRNPLSILFFDTREGNKPGELIGNILSIGITSGHFNEVKVLDLERVFKPKLPQIISKLILLKYLGLRWTYLEEVPAFIGELLNLETLDVKHTCIRTLPSSILRLKKLRNLYLNQRYRSKIEGKLKGNLLENLQMLWGAFIDETSPLLHGLHKLKNLRKLKLAFQLEDEDNQKRLVKLIVQLNQLHSVRLKSVDKMGKPRPIILTNMSKLKNLSSLELFGKLQDPLMVSQLPPVLTHLTLSASNLSDESMSELQKKLTKLISLCFYAESYTEEILVFTKDSFPELRVFRIWKLEKLKNWIIENGAMPSLLELELRSCRYLEFPNDLKHLKTLQKIQLQDMPEKFMTAIEKKRRRFWDDIDIVHDY